ncbi:hypothetical protein EMPS_00955 [Entomortierella parvispora]|uniref:Uncharacterized protein n=1 Tax=Entomortierella parvispora TaxID=205924 RepID=A0A9P3H1Z2_9FUNG|nr:hypothetical protein EMPS_00955 [Entomortierella parvispora]
MMIKTSSALAIMAFASSSMVTAQPTSNIFQTLQSLGGSSKPLGYSFAVAPDHSAACDACLDTNVNNIPDCHNIPLTQGATSISQLTDVEKKCFCTWAKTSSSTWSQGCVSASLCSQAFVNYISSGLVLLEPQTCLANNFPMPSPGLSGGNSGPSGSNAQKNGVAGVAQKSNGGAIAAVALAVVAAAAMF